MRYLIIICLLLSTKYLQSTELKYEQECTITKYTSMEDVKTSVEEFCKEAKHLDSIQVKSVHFQQNDDAFNGIITCWVSEIDKDFLRVQGRIFQRNHSQDSRTH